MQLLTIGLLLFGAGWASADTVSGHWEGTIQIPEHELNIALDLAHDANGTWIGSMSVLKSSSVDVPLAGIRVEDSTVRFTANLPGKASFEGTLSADSLRVSGTAANAEGEAPFQLARTGQANVKIPARSSPLPADFAGAWEGALEGQRVQLRLNASEDGTAMATLIAIEKNMTIPVTTVTIRDRQLQLEARAISGTYRGSLGSNGEISGEWAEGRAVSPWCSSERPESDG